MMLIFPAYGLVQATAGSSYPTAPTITF